MSKQMEDIYWRFHEILRQQAHYALNVRHPGGYGLADGLKSIALLSHKEIDQVFADYIAEARNRNPYQDEQYPDLPPYGDLLRTYSQHNDNPKADE